MSGQQNEVYLNDGNGWLSAAAAGLPIDRAVTTEVEVFDVDGDRDLDLVFANRGGRYSNIGLFLNDGSAKFLDGTLGRVPLDTALSQTIAHGDVDGDGDPDFVVGNSGTRNRLYLNNGKGIFTDVSGFPSDTDVTRAACLGDVDRDGDLDLVLGNWGTQNRIYVNDGKGRFSDATVGKPPALVDYTEAFVLEDLDADGDLDLLVGNWRRTADGYRLLLNDGTGTFTDATKSRLPDEQTGTPMLAIGDFDGDGDPDIASDTNNHRSRFYVNRHRQVSAPYLAMLGSPYELVFDAKPGYAPPGQLAIGFVNLTPASQPIPIPPFGDFRLGLLGLVTLPAVTIPATTGSARLRLTVPRVPGLVGRTIYTQALVLHAQPLASWRFSNVNADRIVN